LTHRCFVDETNTCTCLCPDEPAVQWILDPRTPRGAESCDTVCAGVSETCDQSSLDNLNNDAAFEAAFEAWSPGHCTSWNTGCTSGNHCAAWGSPFIHNSHINDNSNYANGNGLCWKGGPVAACGQRPVDGHHRRLCPCTTTVPSCPTPAEFSSSTTYPVHAGSGSSDNYWNYCNYMVTATCGDMCADATRGRCSDECDRHTHNMQTIQCPASYTLPHASSGVFDNIADRAVGATASAACDISATPAGSSSSAQRFLSPTLNIAKVEAALGGSAKTHKNSHAGKGLSTIDTTVDYPLCGANEQWGKNIAKNKPTSKSHTDNQHMADRFCLYHGYTTATDIEVVAEGGACAVYHKEGNGRRIDNEHGLKLSSINCVNNLGFHAFANPTIVIATAEATLGGSGDAAAYAAGLSAKKASKHVSPDDTKPYELCAGSHASGNYASSKKASGHHGAKGTNNHHMAQRFCQLEGYTGVDSFKIAEIETSGCALYHDDGEGRRWDNKNDYKITEIVCTKPVASTDPVITCQADGTWEPDRSCRCNIGLDGVSASGTFTAPTVDLFALELALGGSGNPLAVKAKHQAPSSAPMLLCAEEGVNGNAVAVDGGVSKHGSAHTNNAHMADRFCEFNGYPGGHVSIETIRTTQGGECAVYHNDGIGRRYDNDHVEKISKIVCVGQC
jgi:hypothetical protein